MGVEMVSDYRERAAECVRLASETTNLQHRAALLEMAQSWLRLLDQAEKNAQADLTYETPARPVHLPQQPRIERDD
jgi:hypothetical protein